MYRWVMGVERIHLLLTLFLLFQQQGSDSDLSLAGDLRGSKQSVKGRLSGMFRRSGSAINSSRAGSAEKISGSAAAEKPVAVQTICTDALPASTHPPPSPSPARLRATKQTVVSEEWWTSGRGILD